MLLRSIITEENKWYLEKFLTDVSEKKESLDNISFLKCLENNFNHFRILFSENFKFPLYF